MLNTRGNARWPIFPPISIGATAAIICPTTANLLANIFRWAAADRIPLEVRGPGLIDCHLYRQPGRLILHL